MSITSTYSPIGRRLADEIVRILGGWTPAYIVKESDSKIKIVRESDNKIKIVRESDNKIKIVRERQ